MTLNVKKENKENPAEGSTFVITEFTDFELHKKALEQYEAAGI